MINFYLFDYALNLLIRYKKKNIFVFIILTLMVWLLASVLFFSHSLEYELQQNIDGFGDITIQNTHAGLYAPIDESLADTLLEIDGIASIQSSVWGYYHFRQGDCDLKLVGIDQFDTLLRDSLVDIAQHADINASSMIISPVVYKLFTQYYYDKYFNFIRPDGSIKKVDIQGVYKKFVPINQYNMVVMDKQTLRDIFGFSENEVSSLYIKVANPKEIATIAKKIATRYPNLVVTTQQDIKNSYTQLFNFKSGLFLSLFSITFMTFFMIVYDKASGLSSEEKKEIGVLKALGWRIEDVIRVKLYEAVVLSLSSYLIGIIAALGFVYIYGGGFLQQLFIEQNGITRNYHPSFVLDPKTFFILFLLSVVVYIGATIIPSWRVATQDADEVLR